jgi:hypothetical protein
MIFVDLPGQGRDCVGLIGEGSSKIPKLTSRAWIARKPAQPLSTLYRFRAVLEAAVLTIRSEA